jgi:hypothetical protein
MLQSPYCEEGSHSVTDLGACFILIRENPLRSGAPEFRLSRDLTRSAASTFGVRLGKNRCPVCSVPRLRDAASSSLNFNICPALDSRTWCNSILIEKWRGVAFRFLTSDVRGGGRIP